MPTVNDDYLYSFDISSANEDIHERSSFQADLTNEYFGVFGAGGGGLTVQVNGPNGDHLITIEETNETVYRAKADLSGTLDTLDLSPIVPDNDWMGVTWMSGDRMAVAHNQIHTDKIPEIWILDGFTTTVLAHWSLGSDYYPYPRLGWDSKNDMLLIAKSGTNEIARWDPSNQTEVDTFSVGTSARGLDMRPDDESIIVLHSDNDTYSKWDYFGGNQQDSFDAVARDDTSGLTWMDNEKYLVGPDKPTCSVDATGDEYADLSSSAYSHPNDVAHQDSRWQVRQATASNWTNPEYDSGWTSSDLEAHTANPIPIEDDLEARVAHRDTNDLLTWSDPVTLSTTGTIKQGEGPEGLFFGEKNGNRILRFGRAFQDDGTNIKAKLESNHVAPAGAQGEAVFRSLYITVETGTDVDFTFTPIIDGTEDTNARVTHQHRPASKTRDTIEVALAKDVTDSAGNPVAKVGLRGSWFGVKIEATDVLGSGNKVNLEGVELEVETVREQAGSVNEV